MTERCTRCDGCGQIAEWEFPATDTLRYVVSEAYPWDTKWYVWRDGRGADGRWEVDIHHQCGPAFRSLTAACAYAEGLAAKARDDATDWGGWDGR